MDDYEQFRAKGVEVVACVSVNDPFVMAAWGESKNANGKVRMLADTSAEFTKVYYILYDDVEMWIVQTFSHSDCGTKHIHL